jgi:hypothetical protein
MEKALLAVLTDAERLLVLETEPAALAALDEDAVGELHARVRRARNKYVGQYRRGGATKVRGTGGRGKARQQNTTARTKAEAFEQALSRVSRRYAVLQSPRSTRQPRRRAGRSRPAAQRRRPRTPPRRPRRRARPRRRVRPSPRPPRPATVRSRAPPPPSDARRPVPPEPAARSRATPAEGPGSTPARRPCSMSPKWWDCAVQLHNPTTSFGEARASSGGAG